jgi:translation initiation factor 3 subunit K
MNPEQVEQLMAGGGRYDVEILPQLEEHLEEQLEKATYDLEANLAILKLYLLNPSEAKVKVYEGILVKALMAFPATDFALCMYQIPEKYHAQLKDPIKLSQHLEMAKFKAFWKTAEEQMTAAKESEGSEAALGGISRAKEWQEAVQKFVCGVVNSTYRSIHADQLAELLNRPASDIEKIIKANNWTRSKDDKEKIVVREDASFEKARAEPKASTTMSLDMYKQLFNASSSA